VRLRFQERSELKSVSRTIPMESGAVILRSCSEIWSSYNNYQDALQYIPVISVNNCLKHALIRKMVFLTIALSKIFAGVTTAQDTLVNPVSATPLKYYAQGGVVVNGIAYFTSDDGKFLKTGMRSKDFHGVVAFDVRTLRKVRTYHFGQTYDSSPFLFRRTDGTWVIIAHEHLNRQTVARCRDTDTLVWKSETNQPGSMFFGYSSFLRPAGTQLIFMSCDNGLHAMSGETGKDVWWIRQKSSGGVTPCVDQGNGFVYYQCDAKLFKIRAEDGGIIRSVPVESPSVCVSWNTVLVNDSYGYYIATRWYGKPEWDCAIRVYDRDLNLVWEHKGLPNGKKDTFTYVDGKLLTGSGNGWSMQYESGGNSWKVLNAYSIRDGSVVWKCDLSNIPYQSLSNAPYYKGFFYAETWGGKYGPSHLLRIRASDGKIVEDLSYGRPVNSCAPCIIAHGRVLSGDLNEDRIVVTRIAENSGLDWPGPFGHPLTNQCALPDEPAAKLVPMAEIGR